MYDGSFKADMETYSLRCKGYILHFALTYSQYVPDGIDLNWADLDGWEIRRKIKNWCDENKILDYKIRRATEYKADLHGSRVYELWIKS